MLRLTLEIREAESELHGHYIEVSGGGKKQKFLATTKERQGQFSISEAVKSFIKNDLGLR